MPQQRRPANVMPRPAAATPSRRQIMLATESTRQVTTEEEINDGETREVLARGARVEHTTSSRVTVWQPTDNGRWVPKEISSTNLAENFEMGWRTECGNCMTTHGIEDDPIAGADINACPAVPKLLVAYCPTCAKKVVDPGMAQTAKGVRDENAVDLYQKQSTPETRLRAQMDLHILTYHPNDAAGYGIVDTRPVPGRIV